MNMDFILNVQKQGWNLTTRSKLTMKSTHPLPVLKNSTQTRIVIQRPPQCYRQVIDQVPMTRTSQLK